MIAPVAIAGILIMAVLANQAYSRSVSHSVKCKVTRGGPSQCVSETHHERSTAEAKPTSAARATSQKSSNTGNGRTNTFVFNPPTSLQKNSNTLTTLIKVKCPTSGYARIPGIKGPLGLRHCMPGEEVKMPQGSGNVVQGTPQKSSVTGNAAQEKGATLKCPTNGYMRIPGIKGPLGLRHCMPGEEVKMPQGSRPHT